MFCDARVMTLEGEELRELLARHGLTPVEEVQPPSDEGVVWLLHAGADDWFATWQLLRDLVPQTGRWPLAVTDVATGWNQPPSPGRRDRRPGRVMRRLAAVDVPALLDELERDADPEPLGEWLDFHLEDTEELCRTRTDRRGGAVRTRRDHNRDSRGAVAAGLGAPALPWRQRG